MYLIWRYFFLAKINEHKQFMHDTVWCNQMGTVFAEMSSRTALTRHLWMKTTFYTKYITANVFVLLLWLLYANAYKHYKSTKPQLYEFLVVMCYISLNMNFLQSLFKFEIFIIKIPQDSSFIFLVLKCCLCHFIPR